MNGKGFIKLFIGRHLWSSCYRTYAVLFWENNDEQNNLSLLEVQYLAGEKKSKETVINQCVSAVIKACMDAYLCLGGRCVTVLWEMTTQNWFVKDKYKLL